jgi:hypothetical protein
MAHASLLRTNRASRALGAPGSSGVWGFYDAGVNAAAAERRVCFFFSTAATRRSVTSIGLARETGKG